MATKTRTIQRFRLEEIADLANVYDYSIRTYSGRGMYGAECVGVVLDSQRDVYRFLVAMGSLLTESADENVADPTEEAMEMAGRLQVDSMGRGVVVYFPGFVLDGPDDEPDEG